MSMPNSLESFDFKALLESMTTSSGVYQMINAEGVILYVGKAKNLKKRLQSYFRTTQSSVKTRSMISQVADIQVTITHSDVEALLLEHTLIKKHLPRYNVLLRDDKSYPYILISGDENYPRISLYRGPKKRQERSYGPYPSSSAARETLIFLQRIFKLRPCRDSFFKHRTRPCLQYQIKRCSAPCVEYISKEAYQADLKHAELFLSGKNKTIITALTNKMKEASAALNFELAAYLRDQIAALETVQTQQSVITNKTDIDVIYLLRDDSMLIVQIVFIRQGDVISTKTYYPTSPPELSEDEIMSAFLSQYYLQISAMSDWPKEIVVSTALNDKLVLSKSFSEIASKKVMITTHPRKEKKQWLLLAKQNAQFAYDKLLIDKGHNKKRIQLLADVLGLKTLPSRIECFDISHTLGESTVASCVVYDEQGMQKSQYRRFNIQGITAGDDYAAMHQALLRRYQDVLKMQSPLPDILLIDGGKGQVHEAKKVLAALALSEKILLLGISKGPSRKAGLETLHIAHNDEALILSEDSPALHLLQQIRDEAHRFAISGHRKQRAKTRKKSVLEEIEGVGSVRRRALIRHFGGIQALKKASIEEIEKVSGIDRKLAKVIFEKLHQV